MYFLIPFYKIINIICIFNIQQYNIVNKIGILRL